MAISEEDAEDVADRAAQEAGSADEHGLLEYAALLEGRKDNAYWERNKLLALISRIFPSHLSRHPAEEEWEDDWRNIVCVHLPSGQATWHIHDQELANFQHLEWGENHWDGHDTLEKYDRVDQVGEGP